MKSKYDYEIAIDELLDSALNELSPTAFDELLDSILFMLQDYDREGET